ncbi:amino acid permease [Leishmania tarentolae]|uniref:Amino acid permease n=1 Tax=Leishmania tarentolae TaxID=5689 RepID=A0A640KUK2_LEITA|nr:amino acid permease [Leishmania tarentolae]
MMESAPRTDEPTAASPSAGQRSQCLPPSQPRHTGFLGVLESIRDACLKAVYVIVPPGGILSGAFNMASASIGAGILGLPAATDSAGIILSMIFIVIITYFSVFSMYILALASENTGIKTFEGLARWLFPAKRYAFSYWAAFIRFFHGFSGCVAYVISVGNCFGAIFTGAEKQNPDNSAIRFLASTQGNRVLTVIVWVCIMLPMVIPKHIDSLRYASAIAVTFMVYFVFVVVAHSSRNGLSETSKHVVVSGNQADDDKLEHNSVFLFRTGNSVIHSVGIFVFAYVCQINAQEVLWDMRPEVRTTKNYTLAALIGMLLCGTLYVLVSVFGYFDFGTKNLQGKSLLLMFNPLEEAYIMVAYVAVMIKLCVAYALLTIAARNSLYYLIGFQHRYGNRTEAVVAEERSSLSDDADATVQSGKPDGVDKNHSMEGTMKDRNSPYAADEGAGEKFVDGNEESTTYVDNIPFWQHVIVVLVLSVASLLCGLFIPNINTVFGFAGSISGGFIAFIFPALFVMYSGNFTVAQVGWFTYLNTYLLLICGVVGIVFGTGGTIYVTI